MSVHAYHTCTFEIELSLRISGILRTSDGKVFDIEVDSGRELEVNKVTQMRQWS